jgi:hypothetical protein
MTSRRVFLASLPAAGLATALSATTQAATTSEVADLMLTQLQRVAPGDWRATINLELDFVLFVRHGGEVSPLSAEVAP